MRVILNNIGSNGRNIEALFPAYRPVFKKDTVSLSPVWAARLFNGEVIIVSDSGPVIAK